MTDHTEAITTARDEAGEARYDRTAFLVVLAILVVAPAVVYPVLLMKALCFALFACAFNLLIGFGGLLSFGRAMFLGTAGYLAAHSAKVWGFPTELAILTGMAASTVLGVFAGLLAIRREGIYFAMITLALAQMVFFYALQAPFTGGEDGIQSVPRRGGLGTVFGPVVAAFVIASMEHYLSELGQWVIIVQGVIFVFCVLAFRRGIMGELEAWLRSRRK